MPATARRFSPAWLWPLAIALLVVTASSRSHVAGPEISGSDKVAHFGVYALMATLVCRTFAPGWRGALWSLAIVAAFGATDEWHQAYVPGRSPSVMDWIADTLGAATAVVLYTAVPQYRRLLERPLGRRESAGLKNPTPAQESRLDDRPVR